MFSSYRRIFAAPGSVAFTLTGLLGRLPIGMTGVAAVFMITGAHGSYGLAGALAATVLLVVAVAGPQISRLVDRHGQARVAVPALLLSTGGGLAELLCLDWHAPHWTLFPTAAVTGLGPNLGSMSRARWAALYAGDEDVLHSAYAFESVLDELCFILGPIAATALATGLFPSAGFLVAGLLILVGGLAFCAQRRTEPQLRRDATEERGSAMRSPGLRVLVLTLVATGGVFGIMEITTIGFADAHGHKAAASLVLSCYALGSCVSGLAFGLWKPSGGAARRLVLCLLAMTVSLSPLPFVDSLPELAAVLLVSGLTTAPTMVTSMGLVREAVPQARLTEGFSWAVTGLLLGVSGGAAVGGWAVQHLGAGAGYRIPMATGALAVLIALLGARRATGPIPAAAPAAAPAPVPTGTDASEPSGRAAQVQ
ncbi:MFS family permease [Streptacidiphilus sp. MAP12-16]|uniref:MFS transporter n=1 Tax=Streptacidiphilus sp. MAP12-16 TaxID=3156300 RepID=UPI0035110261